MMAKTYIERIKSKAASETYRDNFDRIFRKSRTPFSGRPIMHLSVQTELHSQFWNPSEWDGVTVVMHPDSLDAFPLPAVGETVGPEWFKARGADEIAQECQAKTSSMGGTVGQGKFDGWPSLRFMVVEVDQTEGLIQFETAS
jgi:hypothetical protein